jgi:hypothetical protein
MLRAMANASSYPALDNKFNAVSFDPVTTTKLRVSLQSGQGSVGVIQWVVPSIRPARAPVRRSEQHAIEVLFITIIAPALVTVRQRWSRGR